MPFFSKHFRRSEAPWEVVDCGDITPVPMWDEEDGIEVLRLLENDISFEFKHELRRIVDLRKAVLFARQQLMQDASGLGFNILLMEGWQYTLLRKGNRYRLDVVYRGRPAYAAGKITPQPPPPFLDVLDRCKQQMHGFVPTSASSSAVRISKARIVV
ncbi:hypothetical protein BDW22DRAFT_1103518 [Trametopsis cervina]|nr:hypothetical protein BDW22DRAFT_1103518 [Trametopsis cervina]